MTPLMTSKKALLKWAGVALLGLLLVLTVARSRTALERGNRLYRAGNAQSAANVYAVRTDNSSDGRRASYNLGTALVQLGSEQAEQYLIRAIEGQDSAAVQRAHYNLAYRLLTGVEENSDPFSAVPLLSAAIDHNRAALRLNPTDEDAKWNLALAVRAYSELAQVFEEGPAESTGGEIDVPEDESESGGSESGSGGAGEEVENAPPPENRGSPDGITVGVSEALAGTDPGPLSVEMVNQVLEERVDDTELLVRGLLWSQRPDVRWWEGEPLPGGRW